MIKIRERKNGSAGTDVTNYYIYNCMFYEKFIKKSKTGSVKNAKSIFTAALFIFSQITRF